MCHNITQCGTIQHNVAQCRRMSQFQSKPGHWPILELNVEDPVHFQSRRGNISNHGQLWSAQIAQRYKMLHNVPVHTVCRALCTVHRVVVSASHFLALDRNDGQFFKAMEWRWLFFSNDGMAMVFENSHHHHRWFLAGSTIGNDGFSMVFPILGTNGSRWLLKGSL